MANDILRFAILGLGAGAVYAVTALGIVLVYRGSGVVNFAHGAIGMVGAFVFYDARERGTSTLLAWMLAVSVGVAIGVVVYLVMRLLRRAPAISRLIATLGVFTVLFAYMHDKKGDLPQIVQKLLPVDGVPLDDELFGLLPDISIGKDRLILLAVGVVLTIVLTLVYRFTPFGLATSAVAENRRATAAQGISPEVVASVNWMLGSATAVIAAILIVNIAGLQVTGLTLLIVPALAAALVGGFRSFPLTLFGGLLIGVLQAEVSWLQTYLTERQGEPVTLAGWAETVPFLVIIVVLVAFGRALPLRGEPTARPPEVGSGRLRPFVLVPLIVGAIALTTLVFSTDLVEAVTTSAALAIIVLSLVVVTGYAGQLSLAQFALAGMGAWIAAALVANEGFSFEVAAFCGAVGAIPVGVLVGLPSLRTRGVNLAVATLGLALVIQAQVLANADRTGGLEGLQVGTPSLFGLDVDSLAHPERYAVLAVVCLLVVTVAVTNLRRGRAGRRLVAVRSNERAAAALGISVFGAKLYAFGLAAGIAAVGGILIVFRNPTAVFIPEFSVFQSIFVVIYAVIGGVGFVLGAVIGGVVAPGAFATQLFGDLLGDEETVRFVLGLVVLIVLLLVPNGLASLAARISAAVNSRERPPEVLPDVELERVDAATLEVRGLSVRFGGVHAVADVSLELRAGEVLGLIGPNGAGKTTLIDAITGFVRARGEVCLNGVSIERWSARRRACAGMGRSFQSLELFESLSVRENLRVASERRDPGAYVSDLVWPQRAPLTAAAVLALREFGLEPDLDRRPEELPYGRRRLVAIARAVAARPSVLLLDEPAAGLDDEESAELGRLIRRLADEWGLAVLLVEHDVGLVMRVSDRVVVLDEGRQLAEGPPEEIRRDRAVIAAYLGEPVDAPDAEEEAVAADVAAPVVEPTGAAGGEPETLVRVRGLSAGYGDLAAVRDLDLEVHAGEIVALLGPNGAGKTTTLLAIAGELKPLAGEIECLGASSHAALHRRAKRGLGFVPEERAVISSLTTSGNLRLGRGSTGRALELFPELEPLLRRRAGLLSGGEQQMLTLGRALSTQPRLLLVDELSLGLAPLVVARLLRAVRAAADAGVGVLLVEQHAGEAMSIADRAVVLRHGRVELAGSAAELRDHLTEIEAAYLTGVGKD
jgi:sulfate-transporting ATPase